MTDSEIIKALGAIEPTEFEKAPAVMMEFKTAKEILDLINRQKEEISKKDIEIDILIQKKEDLSDEVSDLRAEVERLQVENEIKSQKRANIFEIADAYERGRTAGMKEFAERLKDDCYIPYTSWTIERVVDESDIDNLVKELTEVSNGE